MTWRPSIEPHDTFYTLCGRGAPEYWYWWSRGVPRVVAWVVPMDGSVWLILAHSGSFWSILVNSGQFW